MDAYTLGAIIGIVIVVIIIIGTLAHKAKLKLNSTAVWEQRMRTLNENTNLFNKKLSEIGFKTDLKISTKAYHHTASLHEIFNFCVDYDKKKIAVCSLETAEFKPVIMSFDEIASFKIINGVQNTTSQSFTTGGVAGAYGIGGGIASTDTYTETTLEQVKLRLDYANSLKPAAIIMMFTYKVDMSSDMYKILVDAMEQIDSVLTKIINSNKN